MLSAQPPLTASNIVGGEYEVTIWSISETWVIIFCGSLPAMKPLWDHYISKGGKESSLLNCNVGRPDDYGLAKMRPKPKIFSLNETRIESVVPPPPRRARSRRDRLDLEERGIRATTRVEISRSFVIFTDEKALAFPID